MKNKKLRIASLVVGFAFQSFFGLTQTAVDSSLHESGVGLFPKKAPSALENISISGYYRFLACYSNMDLQYPEFQGVNKRVFIGDDSNIPQLMLNLGLRPTKNTSVSTDFYLWTPMSGSNKDYVKGLNLGINLTGTHSTKYGIFSVKTGGIHWYSLSPMTFATNIGYNRFSLFERNPWDPNTSSVLERYKRFYTDGALNQDIRWGQQAFQGFILEGARLPKDFSFAFMHGKSQYNGGALPLPNTLTAGKIKKNFGTNFVSANVIASKTFSDSLTKNVLGYELITSEFNFKIKEITLLGEIGSGNYHSPTYQAKWGEALDIKIQFSKKATFFPLEVRYYQISPYVINNNGVFWNSSIMEYNNALNNTETPGSQPSLIPFASSLVSIGQLTNNRRGLILNMELPFKHQKIAIGYSAAKEIIALSDKITYGHTANNLAMSRFWRWGFPANVGPYNNINKIYRGVYETLQITDSIRAKGFNSVEISYKTNFKLFNRELMFFYLGGFHSVQSDFSILPKYSKKAYLQSYNNQFEIYYLLFPKLVISNYLGYDRIMANSQTKLDAVSNLPKNQTGLSYAIGIDFQLAKNTGLYIRQRWFKYHDANYSLDKYAGTETTVELKIFF